MANGLVLLELDDRVATIRINRPQKNNTVDPAVLAELEQVVEAVAGMADLAAIVVTGVGDRAFCGGLDGTTLIEKGGAAASVLLRRLWQACWRLAHLPPPVIAAINGYALLGGVVLAFSSDLRIAVESATFMNPGAEYGVAVATHQMPYLVGDCAAKEMILLAEPVDAATLYRMGLLNRVVPTQEEMWATVDRWVNRLRQCSLTGVRNSKALLNQALEMGPAAALRAELANDAREALNPDFRNRAAAARLARGRRGEQGGQS